MLRTPMCLGPKNFPRNWECVYTSPMCVSALPCPRNLVEHWIYRQNIAINWKLSAKSREIFGFFAQFEKGKHVIENKGCHVPIIGFPCSAIGDNLMGLCQHDQRGNLSLGGVTHLYRLGGNVMYIANVHIVQFAPWKNPRDFSLSKAILPLLYTKCPLLCMR